MNTKKDTLKYKKFYFNAWNILSLIMIIALINNLYFSDVAVGFIDRPISLLGFETILNTQNMSWGFISINLIIFILTNLESFFKIKGLFLILTIMSWMFIPITIFNIYYMIKNKII